MSATKGFVRYQGEIPGQMFITFEGIDGCGKSTHSSILRDHLTAKGNGVLLTHEPGDGGEVCLNIRETILLEDMKTADPLAELFLFCADRVCHVQKVIKPSLEKGEIVISDRFFDSTIVYQGYGRGIDLEFVTRAARRAALDLEPDITFVLDVPIHLCRERINKRETSGDSVNRMDREASMFYERLREGFLAEAGKDPERIKIIDASREISDTQKEIATIVDGKLGI